MRAIAIVISTDPYDNSSQIARLRELGAPENVLPTETNRQVLLKERLIPLLGFYKNCQWKHELTHVETEKITCYVGFQYQPIMIFQELGRLREREIVLEYRVGTLNKQSVFIAATEQAAKRKTA
jgi:hypothetical protein